MKKREKKTAEKPEDDTPRMLLYQAPLTSHDDMGANEHQDDGDCWCDPELQFQDPETNQEFWLHKQVYSLH